MGRPKKQLDKNPTTSEIAADERELEDDGPVMGERFTCNAFPNLSFLVGSDKYQFQGGEFITDDPKIIKAVCGLQHFGACIFADNPELNPQMPPDLEDMKVAEAGQEEAE